MCACTKHSGGKNKAEANKPDSIRHCFRVQKNNKVDILVDNLTKLYKPRRPYFCVYNDCAYNTI